MYIHIYEGVSWFILHPPVPLHNFRSEGKEKRLKFKYDPKREGKIYRLRFCVLYNGMYEIFINTARLLFATYV